MGSAGEERAYHLVVESGPKADHGGVGASQVHSRVAGLKELAGC